MLGIQFVHELLEEEIAALCGPRGAHKRGKLAHRGGSEQGWIGLTGQRVRVRRPRARRDGKEVPLTRYEALQSMENISDVVSRMMLNGLSTRRYDRTIDRFESDLGLSKSEVSRQFRTKSREALNVLNTRTFPESTFWALLIDGTQFAGSTVIIALGVDQAGNKHILGICEGSTENAELCRSLLSRITDRDIRFAGRIVCVLDGSKALRRAVKDAFGKCVEIQRCLLHKRGNIEAKLDRRHHTDLKIRMNQAYHCNEYEDARRAFDSVHRWLAGISHAAAESLNEGRDDLLTLHRIGMPPALRKSFYTTNLIESANSVAKERSGRVKRWRRDTDQLMRWCGAGLLEGEKQFRRVRGCKHIRDFLIDFEKRVAKEDAA